MTLSLILISLMGLLGCGGGAGGGSDPVAEAVVDLEPIDLAPGQTSAQLSWPASEGPVEFYVVWESRGGGNYSRRPGRAMAPTASISGEPGDTVQVVVVAVSSTGEWSEYSPPSPPLNFHPAAAAVTAQATPSGATPVPANTNAETQATTSEADAQSPSEPTDDLELAEMEEAQESDSESASFARLTQSTRELLLRGDTRLPERGLSSHANLWLQGQVDREIGAGVSLVGTGHRNDDELRELVWQDAAAQLFVSDGQGFLESVDAAETFEEALRLNATERFVALADFDGDGTSDWLIEDISTRDVWIVTDEAESSLRANPDQAMAQLLGQGDFDGDGRAELLWIDDDNQLLITGTDASAPSLEPTTRTPDGFEPLTIADLDGDGADDILGRNADGLLVLAQLTIANTDDASPSAATALSIDWRSGPEDTTHSLDLVATLDIDEDGAAEIAWLNGDGDLEIWTTAGGFHLTVEP